MRIEPITTKANRPALAREPDQSFRSKVNAPVLYGFPQESASRTRVRNNCENFRLTNAGKTPSKPWPSYIFREFAAICRRQITLYLRMYAFPLLALAMNRRKESECIRSPQAQEFLLAVALAYALNRPFNRYAVIRLSSRDDLERFLKLFSDWYRSNTGESPYWAYTLEYRSRLLHANLLFHLPEDLLERFTSRISGWVRRCGLSLRSGTFKLKPIWFSNDPHGPDYFLRGLLGLCRYVLKGIDLQYADDYGINAKHQGTVTGKRTGHSANLTLRNLTDSDALERYRTIRAYWKKDVPLPAIPKLGGLQSACKPPEQSPNDPGLIIDVSNLDTPLIRPDAVRDFRRAVTGKKGGDRKSDQAKIKTDIVSIDPKHGNGRAYTLDRLSREEDDFSQFQEKWPEIAQCFQGKKGYRFTQVGKPAAADTDNVTITPPHSDNPYTHSFTVVPGTMELAAA